MKWAKYCCLYFILYFLPLLAKCYINTEISQKRCSPLHCIINYPLKLEMYIERMCHRISYIFFSPSVPSGILYTFPKKQTKWNKTKTFCPQERFILVTSTLVCWANRLPRRVDSISQTFIGSTCVSQVPY